ncbi:MAG: hypothetical protein KTR30_10790 [Saprospiraceae bacterium]|nr:hypothetical protein [Saprospiraceae bacterium]
MDFTVDRKKQKEFLTFRLWDSLKKIFTPTAEEPVELGSLLKVDTHAHWLPGVDDGATSLEEGLEMVESLVEMGFTKLIATPHIKKNFYENEPQELMYAFKDFEKEVKRRRWPVELSLAAEYMLDEGFEAHLEKGLLTLSENMVLIEMSFFQAYQGIEDLLFKIQLKGYQPVIAHPERYIYYFRKIDQLQRFKEMGCFFQLNIPALTGFYGREVYASAKRILNKGWYNFAGTDLHSPRQISSLLTTEFPLGIGNTAHFKL